MNPNDLIKTREDVARYLQPVICGADNLGYSYIRCFHAEYGIKSIVVGSKDVKFVSTSSFADFRQVEGLDRDETLMEALEGIGRELEGRKVPLLLGCGDFYARIFSKHKAELERWFVVPYIDFDLLDRITQKEEFYRICEKLSIPYPKTRSYSCADPAAQIPVDEFSYPVVAKPSNSARYHYAEFEGKKKAFIVETPEELATIFDRLKATAYDRELIVQDYIPGDDSHMGIVACFCDGRGDVRVSGVGKVLLEDHAPAAIGNPVCITSLDMPADELVAHAARFLAHVGYTGYANFDVKYDARDGEYKFFEVNTRPGQSSYFLTLAGVNFVVPIVEQFVLGEQVAERRADEPFIYHAVPRYVVSRTVGEPLRSRALALFAENRRRGKEGCPLISSADNFKHNMWARAVYMNQIRKFKRYVWDKRS